MYYPKGDKLTKQISSTAEILLFLVERSQTASKALLTNALRIANEEEEFYPNEIKSATRVGKLITENEPKALHNTPHRGNTFLRRAAGFTASMVAMHMYNSVNSGQPLVEFLGPVNTNNAADDIYVPTRLVGVNGVTPLQLQFSGDSCEARLNIVPNPISEDVVAKLRTEVVHLKNQGAQETINAALDVIDKPKTYSDASKLLNAAFRTAALKEADLAPRYSDIVLDIDDTKWASIPAVASSISQTNEHLSRLLSAAGGIAAKLPFSEKLVNNGEFIKFVDKEKAKLRNGGVLNTLTGAVGGSSILLPIAEIGGRAMHMYYPYVVALADGVAAKKAPLVKVPEFNTGRGSGIPTLLEVAEFMRREVPLVEDRLRSKRKLSPLIGGA